MDKEGVFFMFLDEARINIKSGDGGRGCVSFRREKFVPLGGPNGGDGGRGGHVFIQASKEIFTLSDFKKRIHFKAERAQHGQGSNKSGKDGRDLVIKVPCGTLIYDENGELLADLVQDGQKILVLHGGWAGKGNAHFKTSTNKAPGFAELGQPGQEMWIRLELRLLAEVGIIGFPNSGKSTLLAKISKARPKIADYPFTTLIPNLGVVRLDNGINITFADIPGLIEGAHKGSGLGDKFLRHISRTKILVHLIDLSGLDIKDPLRDYRIINKELESFSGKIKNIPQIVAGNKIDIISAFEKKDVLENALSKLKIKPVFISALTGEGVGLMIEEVKALIDKLPKEIVYEKTDIKKKIKKNMEVKKKEGVFEVKGEGVQRLVLMTDWDNDEALSYLQFRLKRMGLDEALKKAGAADGDTIRIGSREFEYFKD